MSATSAETRRIAAANCADCVPRIAPTAPNRCDADLADTTAADTENAHYTRREPGVRVVDSKVTSTQDSIQVVSRHCLCVTHTGFGLSPGSRQRLKRTIVLPVGRRRLLSRSCCPRASSSGTVWVSDALLTAREALPGRRPPRTPSRRRRPRSRRAPPPTAFTPQPRDSSRPFGARRSVASHAAAIRVRRRRSRSTRATLAACGRRRSP